MIKLLLTYLPHFIITFPQDNYEDCKDVAIFSIFLNPTFHFYLAPYARKFNTAI